ncbi:flavodoxin family protein [Cryobacterium sp. TMT1-21]|uniref:Flavodoxin family protein n=2 Tax=Microbacteriaceae TaxID=85023 RepID=A0AAQ2HEN3_9MICO|nr:flavodoxin family protein [Cryobacterium shii]TFC88750.1 flavodoxin family protein [Cryobacterium sp. TmT2-59]TFD12330.1 flavodoxin family protein [Cryobacterium sp. TMT1-21]TFD16829.1 flavodoxin family protein [Cryobacterium sp. TMT4-10]TFD21062.1 flavodoxin family protein [Cryobacterium sp. TMT2-23]TFD42567.1 flavodoxin family protein [Cryobacterium sp. TMT2-10]
MSTLVVYDSNFGNTQVIAEAIAAELGEDTRAVPVAGLGLDSLTGVELLVVGGPVNGWRPSPRMQTFLAQFSHGTLRGVRAAAFDTRLRLFIHGDAAGKMAHALERAGAHIVARPVGFVVEGTHGPLAAGELEKAVAWAGSIVSAIHR